MIKLRLLYKEFVNKNKTLHIYDFDDTLVKTNTSVKVIKKDGSVKTLTSGEYATFVPAPGDKFDYSDFDRLIKTSKPIINNIAAIRKSLKTPNVRTTILTARRLAFPIMHHLRNKYGLDTYVIAVGGSNPELKADWIEKQATDHGYKTIKFVDDSQNNINAVVNRMQKHPDVKLDVELVK